MAKKSSKSSGLLRKKQSVSGIRLLVFALAFALVGGVVSWAAFAAPRGGGGGKINGTISLVMVKDQNSDGQPNHSDVVTFSVSTTSTDKPWVKLDCYQNGSWVSTSSAGFFPAYPWDPNFTLGSGAWTSGDGDCKATLYMVTSNGRSKNLAYLNFHVNP